MFQQVERREAEFAQKQKMSARERNNIPIDKKIFNNFLDKFEDENSRCLVCFLVPPTEG